MNKTFNIIFRTALVVVLASLVACGDEKPPASQPKVVSKKIYTEKAKTKPAVDAAARKAKEGPATQTKQGMATPPSASAPKKPTIPAISKGKEMAGAKGSEKPVGTTVPVTSDLIKASLEMASTYDPTGRIDPFAPLFSKETKAPVAQKRAGKKRKRVPQTPLEKVSLSQLKLTAILRMPKGNRALVEDSTGKGYVVKKGTYIGLNAGQVIKVEGDRVLIEEEIQNVMGEYIINNTELKLQKTAGE